MYRFIFGNATVCFKVLIIRTKYDIEGKILKTFFKLSNYLLLFILSVWFLLESSEVISVLRDSSGYPFGHEGSGWRYQSREVYLVSSVIGAVCSLTGIIVSLFVDEKKKLCIRLILVIIVLLVVLEFRLSIN